MPYASPLSSIENPIYLSEDCRSLAGPYDIGISPLLVRACAFD